MERIIALINQKGGVGKTTSTLNLGVALAKLGKKVLLIDLDPQAHLTYSLGIKAHELRYTIYELLKEETSVKNTIIEKFGVHIVPANLNLSGADLELAKVAGREFLLKGAYEPIRGTYEYVLIDCPPSLGLLTLNALVLAEEVFFILQAEYLALQGVSKLINTVEVVKRRLNSCLEVTGVAACRYDQRKNLNKEVVEIIRNHFKEKVFETMIRDNISLAESPSYGMSIFDYKPKSYGAEDYTLLAKEVMAMKSKVLC